MSDLGWADHEEVVEGLRRELADLRAARDAWRSALAFSEVELDKLSNLHLGMTKAVRDRVYKIRDEVAAERVKAIALDRAAP